MSKNQLPVTDLANIATLPIEQRRSRLEAKRAFAPPHSLEFTRRNLGMLLGVVDPLFPSHPRPSTEEILRNFEAKLPKGEKRAGRDRKANLLRAKALLEFSQGAVSRAAKQEYRSFTVAEDTFVKTADALVLEVDGRRCIPSTDLRSSGALVGRGLDFLFSMNYHMIIDDIPEFEDYDLVHLNYWQDKKGSVGVTPIFNSGDPVYSYDELDQMIRETLSIWNDVLDSRRRKSRGEDDGYWFGQSA